MRFFKLFAEVGASVGIILNGYCGTPTTPRRHILNGVCGTWNNAVDTFLYNIEYVEHLHFILYGITDTIAPRPEVMVTKAGSAVGWGVTKAGDWQRCVVLI